jgi:hypothetical protein
MRLFFIGFLSNALIVVFAGLGCIAESHEMHFKAAACFVTALLFLISAIYVKAVRGHYAGGDRG